MDLPNFILSDLVHTINGWLKIHWFRIMMHDSRNCLSCGARFLNRIRHNAYEIHESSEGRGVEVIYPHYFRETLTPTMTTPLTPSIQNRKKNSILGSTQLITTTRFHRLFTVCWCVYVCVYNCMRWTYSYVWMCIYVHLACSCRVFRPEASAISLYFFLLVSLYSIFFFLFYLFYLLFLRTRYVRLFIYPPPF